MRLIDADALIEHLKEYKTVYGTPMTNRDEQVIHCVIGHIKNLEPTAYDVEVVVAELEKEKNRAMRVYERTCVTGGYEHDYADGESNAYEEAISIVRGKE